VGQIGEDPLLHGTDIEVSVKGGIVTFNGRIRSLPEKWAAERAAQRVPGVSAIVDETVMNLPGEAERNDTDIARAAVERLAAITEFPHEKLNVLVRNGFITLEGEVRYFYQKIALVRALSSLIGVRGIYSQLDVKPPVGTVVVKREIEKALQDVEQMDAQRISVAVEDNHVVLRGDVKTWREHEAAREAASKIIGVTDVQNEIQVAPWMF
jgi:osmotically-inducible protein OsmY